MISRFIKRFEKDDYGLVYTTELLISIIILIFIIIIVAEMSEDLNEKALSAEELSNLEKISIESSELLLNNPGVPEDWENNIDDENSINHNIITGLALKTKDVRNGEFKDESGAEEKVISNIISYKKLLKLSGHYDDLVNRNLFNGSFKSSISIYPINPELESLIMGDDLAGSNKDVIVINRTVKCDYLSNLVIYNFNDFELKGENYVKTESCNHDNILNLKSHEEDSNTFWLCKSFRIYKKSLNEYDFYLISPSSIKTADVYYTIENLNNTSDKIYRFNKEIIELDSFFEEDLTNKSNNIYTIHFKVPKRNADDFKTVLVAVPSNMTADLKSRNQLKYEYFRVQDVNFLMKTSYK